MFVLPTQGAIIVIPVSWGQGGGGVGVGGVQGGVRPGFHPPGVLGKKNVLHKRNLWPLLQCITPLLSHLI
jgi:hypothetical protein